MMAQQKLDNLLSFLEILNKLNNSGVKVNREINLTMKAIMALIPDIYAFPTKKS